MKFSKIPSRMAYVDVCFAEKQFTQLIVELGVRENNQHVGSGMGGNNFQLMVLLGMKHVLTKKSDIALQLKKDTIIWGGPWLSTSTRKERRIKLNELFPEIVESRKYEAIALEAMASSNNLRGTLDKYASQFPELMNCLKGNCYNFSKALSGSDKLILASILCQELAMDLDTGNKSKVSTIGAALDDFDPEIILLSVRRHLHLDRLIRFNLDEDPIFVKVLKKVNQAVNF